MLYIFALRAGKITIFEPEVVILTARIIQIYTKFANFTGLYFLHFTTFHNQTMPFYSFKMLFLSWCWISFFLPRSKSSLCKLCNSGEVEDEFHVAFACKKYETLRNNTNDILKDFFQLNTTSQTKQNY